VAEPAVDPRHFFDQFPRFLETSETGPWLDRLNARHFALIHANRELIAGARVLDLASHDGRFSFAALQCGAERVVGIEHDPRLVEKAEENLAFYGAGRGSYDFVTGDMFDRIRAVERCDVVFCFGIFYHINDHMRLLTELAEFDARAVIFDTNVSLIDAAVIELRSPVAGSPPPAGSQIEGWPSRAALEAMWSTLGWTHEYFDWSASGMADHPKLGDYAAGRRLTAVVSSDYRNSSPDVRATAVREVFERQRDPQTQWLTITGVASRHGMTPQALRVWVRQAEREMLRRAAPATDLAPAHDDAVD
jgi:transposase-like protein